MQEHSAGVIIYREEAGERVFLLLHYAAGHWDFAKGHIENGETEEETAIRETEEETGIRQLDFDEDFRHTIKYFYRRDGSTVAKDVVFFLASTKEKKVRISHEHQGFAWLSAEKAKEKITHKSSQQVLGKVLKFLEQ